MGSGLAQNLTNEKIIERIEKLEQESDALRKLQKIKLSGVIQGQYQWGQKDASLKVGSANENADKSFSRVGVRRGRIKLVYEEGIAGGVFQIDLTDKNISVKDVYLTVKDPWLKTIVLKAGVFICPFGHEMSPAASQREAPECSTVFQTLFPEERDLGAMITLQPAKTSPLHFVKLDAGLVAGNGIKQETDSRKDFIGRLSAVKALNNVQLGAGMSYYNGSVYQGTENVYKMTGKSFVPDSNPTNKGKFAKREYTGFDMQVETKSMLGATRLRGEYLYGTQPGKDTSSKSPNSSSLPDDDTYIRKFRGGYVLLAQGLGQLPLTAVLRYDRYDPNTKVSGNDIGLNNTSEGDIARNTFGFGMLWDIIPNLRLQTYYEVNKSEKTENLLARAGGRKEDVFTMRIQYRF